MAKREKKLVVQAASDSPVVQAIQENVALDEFISESELNISTINDEFNIDSINNWTTTVGLITSIIRLVENRISSCQANMFVHMPDCHEYRELDRESISSFADDTVFIGCLAMESGVVPVEQMLEENKIDDPIITELLYKSYNARYIMPIVHGFEMLGYILICEKPNAEPVVLEEGDFYFLTRLNLRVQMNLYAALIAGREQRSLLQMAEYPFVLQGREDMDDLRENLCKDLKHQIDFERAVVYFFDENTKLLYPFSSLNVPEPSQLNLGEGISGQVFKSWHSVFVPDRATHPTYSVMNVEPFFKGSFISATIGTPSNRIGVITVARGEKSKEPFSLEHKYLLEIASAFLATEIINRNLRQKVEETNISMVNSLTNALEAKDLYTEGHSARVALYSVGIARYMNYSEERLKMLLYGAQLHDIGKIGISDAIINKPDFLTATERREIEAHTEIGYNILTVNPYFKKIKNFVRYHHERFDGTGYSKKKLGEYPEEAMVICCADIYDALTTDRPYRKALPVDTAIEILEKEIDKSFTKEIFEAFCKYLENDLKGDRIAKVETKASINR